MADYTENNHYDASDYDSEYLEHYGVKRRSGRYPWGSGDEPYQHSSDFLARVEGLKKAGLSEKEIADAFRISTTELRVQKTLAKNERRQLQVETAKRLRDKEGMSNTEIGRKMGLNESTVRSLLNESSEKNMNKSQEVADYLKKKIDEKGMIDVGSGVENELGVSREKLTEALYILEREGYPTYGGRVDQATNPGKKTIIKVVGPPGTEAKDIYDTRKVNSLFEYKSNEQTITDNGSIKKNNRPDKPDRFVYPESLDSKRLQINYAEEGGIQKDGLIEIRRGKTDLDLGSGVHYAQVRIMVDGKHYLKGMAAYTDDLPEGVDVRFNTNKTKGTPIEKVLKPIKNDPENPFGSLIKEGGQSYYYDKDGKQHLSLINKRAEEGDWGAWAKELPSQFLSKQPMKLVNQQLNLAKADKASELDDIMSLDNPTVKKLLLNKYAEDCDAAAVHLKAAALPRQKYQVILPIPELSDKEIYAPNFKDGEKVSLIRFPHGGTFEIPNLTVNNKNPKAKKMIGLNALDAVGINSSVAERLSGADFDGDTVLVIPNSSKVKIKSSNPLEGLKGFDPKTSYPYEKGMKTMTNTQIEMGKISNLITDMTIKGAVSDELARAVRHSMVVIDAEKHKLNYKKSEKDNGIQELKDKYQRNVDENGNVKYGASTLLSRSKGEVSVGKRRGNAWINETTGELEWERINSKTGEIESKYTNETYIDKKTGKTIKRTQKSTKMAETKDARTLSSGTDVEEAYASYANSLKALANKARKEMIATPNLKQNKESKNKYKKEVDELNAALNVSLKNKPKERRAQLLTNSIVKEQILENNITDKKEIKKLKQKTLTKYRAELGAKRELIDITPKQWEAIQNGAISENKLMQILNNSDIDKIRDYATPKTRNTVSQAKIDKIKTMRDSGYTNAEIADAVGVSASAIHKYIKE